jgi:hypothetical protein
MAGAGPILAAGNYVRPQATSAAVWLTLVLAKGGMAAVDEGAALPPFKARALSGVHKTEQDLLGRPAVLVIAPTKGAAPQCKLWGEELQQTMPPRVMLRALLALDIPFFIPDEYALRKAQEEVPPRLWDRTWLLTHGSVEKKLGVPPEAREPYVFAFDAEGRVVATARGIVTAEKIDRLAEALRCTGKRAASAPAP